MPAADSGGAGEKVMGQTNKTRLDWLDIAKGIAILLMIIGHVPAIPWYPFRKLIFSVHMPLFFITAGYVLGIHNGKINLGKASKRLLLPYGISAALTILMDWIRIGEFHLFTEIKRFIWASGVPVDYGPGVPIVGFETAPMIGALWFLPCMFFGKILFQGTLHTLKKTPEWVRATVVLILTAGGYLLGQSYKLPMGIDIAVFVQIFFYAGYLIQKTDLLNRKGCAITIGAVSTFLWYIALKCDGIELSARLYRPFPACIGSVLGACAGTLVLFAVSSEVLQKIPVIKEFLVFCGKNSLIILCIHHLEPNFIPWDMLFAKIPLTGLSAGILMAGMRILIALGATCLYVFVKQQILRQLRKKQTAA